MMELQKYLDSVRVPKGGDKVYKDECAYSFETPVSMSCTRGVYLISLASETRVYHAYRGGQE